MATVIRAANSGEIQISASQSHAGQGAVKERPILKSWFFAQAALKFAVELAIKLADLSSGTLQYSRCPRGLPAKMG